MNKMDHTTNSINWFEIPVIDLTRAKAFYETIFDVTLGDMDMGEMKMASFPYEAMSGKATGALAQSPNHKPSKEGVILYMNANPDLSAVLGRVEAAGGTIAAPKMPIGEYGNIAYIVDTEGNHIGLHSVQ